MMSKMPVVSVLRERLHFRMKAVEKQLGVDIHDDSMSDDMKKLLTSMSNVPGLPFTVEGIRATAEPDRWVQENCVGQVELEWYPVKTGGRGLRFAFELETDAVMFELRWR